MPICSAISRRNWLLLEDEEVKSFQALREVEIPREVVETNLQLRDFAAGAN